MTDSHQTDFLPFGLDSTATFVLSIVAATLIVSSTIVKVWVSRIQKLRFFASDHYAVISSVVLTASLGLIIYYISIPMQEKYSADDLQSPDDGLQTAYLKAVFVIEIFWPTSLMFSKLSILLLFRRVFTSTKLRVIVSCSMIYIVLLYLAMIFGTIFQCFPVQSFWHDYEGDGPVSCINRQVFFLFSGIPNIVINVVMWILPIFQMIRLTVRRTVLTFLWAIFFLGSLGVGASIARFVEIAQIDGMGSKMARIGGGAAVIVEATVAVLCAYLPTLCPALWRMRPSRRAQTQDTESQPEKKWWEKRLLNNSEVSASRYTGGRTMWPRSRPRPESEFIDPTKPLPREPSNPFMQSLASLSSVPSSQLGDIRVDQTVTTTFERRSRLYEPHPGRKVETSFGTVVDGPGRGN